MAGCQNPGQTTRNQTLSRAATNESTRHIPLQYPTPPTPILLVYDKATSTVLQIDPDNSEASNPARPRELGIGSAKAWKPAAAIDFSVDPGSPSHLRNFFYDED
ncbi:ac23880b-6792-440d-a1b0-91c676af549e [Thermothielavioides terrestris]|uniref:Ac23880b-6792-440d-a1b0-91c676af549e n=1 Tax=Thermothielavioides terrestris TaxID=2587410 RepID=A0A3S4AS20_9PEZI|nr:ac23880b-6792-440d-a1b0-91c676af549e [Thermothielavioides terrestris]